MNTISIKTHAKINLTLDVTEKRPDGYHNIDSIFEEISLYDTVSITVTDSEDITISCDNPDIPCDKNNIVYKASEKFFEYTGIKNRGLHIDIQKNIPSQAGMGGGSTNAAGVLKLLDKLYDTNLTDNELMKTGLSVGADTPFFIKGGLCHVTGIGEIVVPLPSLPKHHIIIAKGEGGISTPAAYKEIDSLKDPVHQNTQKILNAVTNKDINTLMSESINTFEFTQLPDDVLKIKEILKKHSPTGVHMTGSGSAVFGIFTDITKAENALAELKLKNFSFTGLYENI